MDLGKLAAEAKNCPCGVAHDTGAIKRIEIGRGIAEKLGTILREVGIPTSLHVTADKNTLAAAKRAVDSLAPAGFNVTYSVFDDCTLADLAASDRVMSEGENAGGFLAVGTGSLGDITRYAAFRVHKPFALFATAPSMDGFASSVAPIVVNGFKISYITIPPDVIVADSDILAASPAILKAAGFGDILGKYTALADWRIANILTGEYHCEYLERKMREAVDKVVSLADRIASDDAESVEALMEALVLSGLVIFMCGNSRPASGAEHHMSHFWEMRAMMAGQRPDFHGRKVGVGCRYITREYKKLAEYESVKARNIPEVTLEMLREAYFDIADDVLMENTPDLLANTSPRSLEEKWPEIRAELASLPDEEEVIRLLRLAGGVADASEVHVSEELLKEGLEFSCYVRSRPTMQRIAKMII